MSIVAVAVLPAKSSAVTVTVWTPVVSGRAALQFWSPFAVPDQPVFESDHVMYLIPMLSEAVPPRSTFSDAEYVDADVGDVMLIVGGVVS
jgi:hypothetical protein